MARCCEGIRWCYRLPNPKGGMASGHGIPVRTARGVGVYALTQMNNQLERRTVVAIGHKAESFEPEPEPVIVTVIGILNAVDERKLNVF